VGKIGTRMDPGPGKNKNHKKQSSFIWGQNRTTEIEVKQEGKI